MAEVSDQSESTYRMD